VLGTAPRRAPVDARHSLPVTRRDAIEWLGLRGLEQRLPDQLSGSRQRRVAPARAGHRNPPAPAVATRPRRHRNADAPAIATRPRRHRNADAPAIATRLRRYRNPGARVTCEEIELLRR
jgi:hypothetical protein